MSFCQITPTLFLGGADAALNGALVARKGITLIVNVTLSHPCPPYPGVEVLRVPVRDLPDARLGDHFEAVGRRIHANRPGATLVHCAAGRSRSPALVMAYLMRYRGVSLRRAHLWVRDLRPGVSVNAGFWEQLLRYERRLFGGNTVAVEPSAPPGRGGTDDARSAPLALTSRQRASPSETLRSPAVTSRGNPAVNRRKNLWSSSWNATFK
ncbi:dual specificity protein phosphatase 18 [Festucalex cinctus]